MSSQLIHGLRKFAAPEFIFGMGARFQTGRYALNLGIHRVLFISDPGVVAAGWPKDVQDTLDDAGVEWIPFYDLTPNPKDHEVMAGSARYTEAGCDGLIVVGGGSPMDCAKKAVKDPCLVTNPRPATEGEIEEIYEKAL